MTDTPPAPAADTARLLIDPFPADDPLVYGELTPTMLAWRCLLAALADTGATLTIPIDLVPPYPDIQVAAGWRLRYHGHSTPNNSAMHITAAWSSVSHPTGWTAPCAGPDLARDRGRDVIACKGQPVYAVRATSGVIDGVPVAGPFGPLCRAHADAECARISHTGYYATAELIPTTGPASPLVGREPRGEWVP